MEQQTALSNEHIDVLKEVGNICVGNSTGILAQLLDGHVEVCVPALEVVALKNISSYFKEKGKLVYGVNAQIRSQFEGTIFLFFPENDSLKIIEKFLRDINVEGIASVQFGVSIIKEIGGIVIFSYINTLSSLMKKPVVSSVPNFLSGTADELLSMILREYEHWGNVCVIHSSFREKTLNIEGIFYLILDKKSTDLVLQYMLAVDDAGKISGKEF